MPRSTDCVVCVSTLWFCLCLLTCARVPMCVFWQLTWICQCTCEDLGCCTPNWHSIPDLAWNRKTQISLQNLSPIWPISRLYPRMTALSKYILQQVQSRNCTHSQYLDSVQEYRRDAYELKGVVTDFVERLAHRQLPSNTMRHALLVATADTFQGDHECSCCCECIAWRYSMLIHSIQTDWTTQGSLRTTSNVSLTRSWRSKQRRMILTSRWPSSKKWYRGQPCVPTEATETEQLRKKKKKWYGGTP